MARSFATACDNMSIMADCAINNCCLPISEYPERSAALHGFPELPVLFCNYCGYPAAGRCLSGTGNSSARQLRCQHLHWRWRQDENYGWNRQSIQPLLNSMQACLKTQKWHKRRSDGNSSVWTNLICGSIYRSCVYQNPAKNLYSR